MAREVMSAEMLVVRLKRIEGQVRGIQKMIENGRDCESIITHCALGLLVLLVRRDAAPLKCLIT